MRLRRWCCHCIAEDLGPVAEHIDGVAGLLEEEEPVACVVGALDHLLELAEDGAVHVEVDTLIQEGALYFLHAVIQPLQHDAGALSKDQVSLCMVSACQSAQRQDVSVPPEYKKSNLVAHLSVTERRVNSYYTVMTHVSK